MCETGQIVDPLPLYLTTGGGSGVGVAWEWHGNEARVVSDSVKFTVRASCTNCVILTLLLSGKIGSRTG